MLLCTEDLYWRAVIFEIWEFFGNNVNPRPPPPRDGVPLNTRWSLSRTPHGALKGARERTRTEKTLYTIPRPSPEIGYHWIVNCPSHADVRFGAFRCCVLIHLILGSPLPRNIFTFILCLVGSNGPYYGNMNSWSAQRFFSFVLENSFSSEHAVVRWRVQAVRVFLFVYI